MEDVCIMTGKNIESLLVTQGIQQGPQEHILVLQLNYQQNKKRWQEYTEKLYKNHLHDPDNHDGVITHLEPDIVACKVKWALRNITMSKANGGDGIPPELFQILKDDAVKVLHSICQ